MSLVRALWTASVGDGSGGSVLVTAGQPFDSADAVVTRYPTMFAAPAAGTGAMLARVTAAVSNGAGGTTTVRQGTSYTAGSAVVTANPGLFVLDTAAAFARSAASLSNGAGGSVQVAMGQPFASNDAFVTANPGLFVAAGASALITETWTGADGADWPAQWTANTGTGTGQGSDINSNRGRMQSGTTAFGSSRRRLNAALSATDIEILVSVTTSTQAEQYPAVGFRSTTGVQGNFQTSGYVVALLPAANPSLKLMSIAAGGSQTDLNTAAKVLAAGKWWIRINCVGSALKARVWADGGAEPGTWDLNATSSTWGGGYFALSILGGGDTTNDVVYWDDLTITAAT